MTITVLRPPQLSPRPTPEGLPRTQLLKRDRYLDFLRALALIMVMTYHVFGWSWLPILFPSVGIMFALAGSLIASSLDRCPGNPWAVLRKRSIRLLPPLWLFGLVAVPTMLVAGWTQSETAGAPLSWQTLLFWVVPISDPPGSMFGDDWVTPLWFIRSYLWLLLLSPAMAWLFRHWPKRMMALPPAVVLLSTFGLLPLNGRSGDVILSLAMFGGCWMLGFAHHDHRIRALPLTRVLIGGASLMALGLTWAFTHPDPITAYDLNNIPLADTLYGLGAVLILLRLYQDFSWMDQHVVLDKLVTVISSRAITIYLWGGFAIFLAKPLLDLWSVTANLNQDDAPGYVQVYLASWLIVIGFVFMFGWCEDLAARRPMRVNPWPRDQQQLDTLRTRKVLTFPRPTWVAELTPRRLFIVTSCLLAAASAVSAALLLGTNTPGRANTVAARSHIAAHPRPNTEPPVVTDVRLAPVTLTQRPKVLPPAVAAASLARLTKATIPVRPAGVATVRTAAPAVRKTAPVVRKTAKAARQTTKTARPTPGRHPKKPDHQSDRPQLQRTGLHPRRATAAQEDRARPVPRRDRRRPARRVNRSHRGHR